MKKNLSGKAFIKVLAVTLSCLCLYNTVYAQTNQSKETKKIHITRQYISSSSTLRINGTIRTSLKHGDSVKVFYEEGSTLPYQVIVYQFSKHKNLLAYPIKGQDTRGICGIDIEDENIGKHRDSLMAVSIFNLQSDMVLVKGGIFLMGLNDTADIEGGDEARPQHEVTLNDFYISKYEVTQALWMAVMDTNPSMHKDCYVCPVENVSWNEVQYFISKLNFLTNSHYRLPTEAEWEFAARGGLYSRGYYYSGSNNADDVAWYRNLDGTRKVALKKQNELGLFDMSGNVSEWCSDWFEAYPGKTAITDPKGPVNGYLKTIRGGNSIGLMEGCYVFMRGGMLPSYASQYIGFRLVKDAAK